MQEPYENSLLSMSAARFFHRPHPHLFAFDLDRHTVKSGISAQKKAARL